MDAWKLISSIPQNTVVMTKIHDADGARNEQALQRIGNLFWTPDDSMYVYYTPTHWRFMTDGESAAEKRALQKKADGLEQQAARLRQAAR